MRDAKKKGSPFGGAIAHGYLGLSLTPMLMREINPRITDAKFGVNYGLDKVALRSHVSDCGDVGIASMMVQVRFTSPVHVGKQVRLRVKLEAVDDIETGGKGK